jgi:hypothetical protein
MTDHRPLAEIEQDIKDTRAQQRLLTDRVNELHAERDAAKVALATEEASPLLGRRVKLTENTPIRDYVGRITRRVLTTYRGTVVVKTREMGRINGIAYVAAGELVVISASGKKGYRLTDQWQLDEEQSA